MTYKSRTRTAAAAITGGVLVLGGVAVAPALAYPTGTALTVACNATTYAPGATAICTATNTNPAGPNAITLGAKIAQGSGVSFSLASVRGAASTFTQNITLPTTVGTYEVVATSAGERATTTVKVVASGTSAGGSTGGTSGGGAATTPQTGANVGLGLVVGLGALGVGGGLFVASRRKRA